MTSTVFITAVTSGCSQHFLSPCMLSCATRFTENWAPEILFGMCMIAIFCGPFGENCLSPTIAKVPYSFHALYFIIRI